jgi:hypothetical protein
MEALKMARTYGTIETGFWHSLKVKSLSERGKLLLLYALTCPHSNSIGCFTLPIGYVAVDLGWENSTADEHMRELTAAGRIDRDSATDLLRIVGWWGHNNIDNPNVAKNVVKTAAILPKSSPVYGRFIEDLKAYSETLGAGVQEPLRKLFANGSGNGSETVSEGLLEPFRNQNLTEPIQSEPNGAPADAVPSPSAPVLETAKDRLFHLGVPYLVSRAGKTDDAARRVIGGWLKGTSPEAVLDAIAKAQANSAIEPVGYIAAILKPQKPATPDGRPAPYVTGGL